MLRLEDTDRTRFSEDYVKNLYDTFKWLGFYWDEGPDIGGPYGPYVQSERLPLYQEQRQGPDRRRAWPITASATRTASPQLRAAQEDSESPDHGLRPALPGHRPRRTRPIASRPARRRSSASRSPSRATTRFHDALLGDIEWKNEDVSPDPVLLKSDGFPTYHLANVVDDHLMRITHVMRAQEWIPSAPLHIIMYACLRLGACPSSSTCPWSSGRDGHKLSKRHGATAVDEFRKAGYLPEALINYVSHLGCSFEEGRDLFPLADLERLFKVEQPQQGAGDLRLPEARVVQRPIHQDEERRGAARPRHALPGAGRASSAPSRPRRPMALVLGAMPLVKERLRFLADAPTMMRYLFEEPPLPARRGVHPEEAGQGQGRRAPRGRRRAPARLRPLRARGRRKPSSGPRPSAWAPSSATS